MSLLLVAFALVAVLLPSLTRVLGARVFLVAALVPAAAFVHALLLAPRALGAGVVEQWRWIPQLDFSVTFRMDALAFLMTLVVTGVGALVLVYCARYFHTGEAGLARFAAVLLAFAGSMYGLVLADDVYLLFVLWEATSVFSYLLIGHYTSKRASRGAALQALVVTTFGGLAMFVGLVILAVQTGTSRISGIVEAAPTGALTTTAVILVLAGAISKSALVPFHFWLPAAMAAPTPVSAYLHAAAMVKAGIFLVARMAPGFAETPGWRETLVVLGVASMLVGGYRALRQTDLKLVLAYGTVSQLGFLMVIAAYGTTETATAAVALLVAHACFKSTLFLVVGIVDHEAGTRDLTKLSGLGRANPLLAVVAGAALLSMAGLPPTFGFVAKEAVFTSLLHDAQAGGTWGVALAGTVLGSVFTVAYSARFFWGAFAVKAGVERQSHSPLGAFLVSPLVLAAAGLVLGPAASVVGPAFERVGEAAPLVSSLADAALASEPEHLALWHGLQPALGLSAITLVLGLGLFVLRRPVAALQARLAGTPAAADVYRDVIRGIDRSATAVTAFVQRGSLPYYLGTILVVLVLAVTTNVVLGDWNVDLRAWDVPAQVPIVAAMIVGALGATVARTRFPAALLVGMTGYGMAAIFAIQGAPDLALTQVLVETMTLVAFILVLRRLPPQLGTKHGSTHRVARIVVAVAVGTTMAVVVVVAAGARIATPIWLELPDLAYSLGHGYNVVNVALVDLRGWDTLGELTVVVAAATGVASLVFVRTRADELPRMSRRASREAEYSPGRRSWLPSAGEMVPGERSIFLDIVVRLVFHALIVVSIYLLFAGHNAPGGGFAGGLIAGLALVARYLAGGSAELGAASPVRAGRLLGAGLAFAGLTALVPLFFGVDALTSTWIDTELPVLGEFVFVTSTFFDVGVYLIVVGLVLDVLRSLGAEVDAHRADDIRRGRTARIGAPYPEDAPDDVTAGEAVR